MQYGFLSHSRYPVPMSRFRLIADNWKFFPSTNSLAIVLFSHLRLVPKKIPAKLERYCTGAVLHNLNQGIITDDLDIAGILVLVSQEIILT
jgi:hypothetical protein